MGRQLKTSPLLTRDQDIRAKLVPLLRKKYVVTDLDLVIEEFGCKAARVDVAVVNGVLHGFEIKSDSDSLVRLSDQLHTYFGVFDYVTLVCGRKLMRHARELVPRHCGLMLAEWEGPDVRIVEKRKARKNPWRRSHDLAKMMWKDEALEALRSRGFRDVTSRSSASQVWEAAASQLGVDELAYELRMAIKSRGGSGFARQSKLGDDLCTTESTALLDHYSENLAQLLAVLSRGPLR